MFLGLQQRAKDTTQPNVDVSRVRDSFAWISSKCEQDVANQKRGRVSHSYIELSGLSNCMFNGVDDIMLINIAIASF